jgi:5-methylcytosine-specific restriction endonuclease McrA
MSASHYTPKTFSKKEWRRIVREIVLKKADHRCAICGDPAKDVDWVRHPDNGGKESEHNRIATALRPRNCAGNAEAPEGAATRTTSRLVLPLARVACPAQGSSIPGL